MTFLLGAVAVPGQINIDTKDYRILLHSLMIHTMHISLFLLKNQNIANLCYISSLNHS